MFPVTVLTPYHVSMDGALWMPVQKSPGLGSPSLKRVHQAGAIQIIQLLCDLNQSLS